MLRRWFFPVVCLLMAWVATGVYAQTPPASSSTIAVGDTVPGAVSAENIAPSYFFRVDAAQIVYLQLTPSDPAFNPVALVVNTADNTVVATLGGAEAGAALSAAVNVPVAGQYFVQVQGAGGSAGAFTLTLDDAPIVPTALITSTPDASPTAPVTPAPEATETGEVPPLAPPFAVDLPIGTPISGAVTSASPQSLYQLSSGESPLLLTFAAQGDAALSWTVTREGDPSYRLAQVGGVPLAAVVLPGGSLFQIEVALPETTGSTSTFAAYTLAALPYDSALSALLLSGRVGEDTIAAAPTDALALATNTPDASAAPDVSPTPEPTATLTPTVAPSDIDLALRWNGTYFLITNVSGAPLGIHDLSFEGLNRRANADTWTQLGTVDVRSIPAGACVGFRPLAYPDAPPLAGGCSDLAAWWVSDALAFWLAADSPAGPGTFAVFYNGQPLATCYTRDGGCSVDMPNG